MSHGVPDFATLVKNYPNLKNSEIVKRMIGGHVGMTVGQQGFENTCTIRIIPDLDEDDSFDRHCERSEAIQGRQVLALPLDCFAKRLAMTSFRPVRHTETWYKQP